MRERHPGQLYHSGCPYGWSQEERLWLAPRSRGHSQVLLSKNHCYRSLRPQGGISLVSGDAQKGAPSAPFTEPALPFRLAAKTACNQRVDYQLAHLNYPYDSTK